MHKLIAQHVSEKQHSHLARLFCHNRAKSHELGTNFEGDCNIQIVIYRSKKIMGS